MSAVCGPLSDPWGRHPQDNQLDVDCNNVPVQLQYIVDDHLSDATVALCPQNVTSAEIAAGASAPGEFSCTEGEGSDSSLPVVGSGPGSECCIAKHVGVKSRISPLENHSFPGLGLHLLWHASPTSACHSFPGRCLCARHSSGLHP